MNIYVISSCWWRDGSTVIGAATDRAGAEAIADRHEHEDSRAASWTPWKEDVSPAEGSCTWRRDALVADGTVHPSLYQEIVCVPLAGYIADWPVLQPIDETGPALLRDVPALTVGREVIDNIRSFTTGPG